MESIAAHAILGVEFVGKCVHVGIVGHGLVESRVEDTHLGQVGEEFADGIHSLDVGRVVEGCEVVACGEGLHDLRSESDALVELLTSMHHAVSYGIQFLQASQYGIFSRGEYLEDPLHAGGVLLYGTLHLVLLAIELYGDETVGQTDFLDSTTCDDALVVHVVERVFDRTASAVENQNLHFLAY